MAHHRMQNLLIKLPEISNTIAARWLQRTGAIEGYQPTEDHTGKRSCHDRWQVIQPHINSGDLCLDIGCNTGFFSHAVAAAGIFTIGFDLQAKNIIAAQNEYCRNDLIFKKLELSKETVEALPSADFVLFLSVFHHLVKYTSEEEATGVLSSLADRCRKHFFFETGQPDETGTKFYKKMAFMGDVETWTRHFFLDRCHFSAIHQLGTFDTFLSPVPRKLFLAMR